jgi:hypothetical protein
VSIPQGEPSDPFPTETHGDVEHGRLPNRQST